MAARVPFDRSVIAARWPSIDFGVEEWVQVFDDHPAVYEALIDSIIRVNPNTIRHQQESRATVRRAERARMRKPQRRQSRERMVLQAVAHGQGQADIARAWRVDQSSPGYHLKRLRRRYSVGSTHGLVAYAFRDLHEDELPEPARPFLLQRRQHEALVLLGRGYSRSKVAAEMGISYSTVKTHLDSVFESLDVLGATAAVSYAFRGGMLRWHDGEIAGMRGREWVHPSG